MFKLWSLIFQLHVYIMLAIYIGIGFCDGNVVEQKSGISMACFNETYPLPVGNTCTDITEELRTARNIQWYNMAFRELYGLIREAKTVLRNRRHKYCILLTTLDIVQVREICCSVKIPYMQCTGITTSSEDSCHYITYSQSFTKSTCDIDRGVHTRSHFTTVVMTIIEHVKWRNVMVFSEADLDPLLDGIMIAFSTSHLMATSYVVDHQCSADVHRFIDKMADWSQPIRLHMLVICRSQCRHLLSMINTYDSSDPLIRTTRHFAEVIIFDTSKSNTTSQYSFEDIYLDNLVIIQTDRQEEIQCKGIQIFTLMWTHQPKSRPGRGLSTVGYVFANMSLEVCSSLFPNKAFGLNGRHFKGTTLEWTPFVNILSNGLKDDYNGLCFDIFDEIASKFNFTYEVTLPPDGLWGLPLDNGSWVGAIGLLQRKETAFVVSALNVLNIRELVMDFTHPFYFDYTAIVMAKTDQSQQKWKTLMKPYQYTVFLCVGISLIVGSLCMYLIEKVNPFYKSHQHISTGERFITYQHALWYLYGALLTQGGERLPYSQTGRTFLGCWWIFSMILLATYTGNLMASLTVTVDKKPFETLSEMVALEDIKWGVVGGSYWVTIFKESELNDFKTVWKGLKKFNETDPTVLSIHPDDHFEKVLQENYAYIGDNTKIQFRMAQECELTKARERLMPFQYAFGLPNNSPFTKMFSNRIIKIQESGLLHIWKKRHWPKSNLSCVIETTSGKPITVVEVQSAFYLIALGVGLSAIILISEKISIPILKNRKSKSTFESNICSLHVSASNMCDL